jgi:hypothetical protein
MGTGESPNLNIVLSQKVPHVVTFQLMSKLQNANFGAIKHALLQYAFIDLSWTLDLMRTSSISCAGGDNVSGQGNSD